MPRRDYVWTDSLRWPPQSDMFADAYDYGEVRWRIKLGLEAQELRFVETQAVVNEARATRLLCESLLQQQPQPPLAHDLDSGARRLRDAEVELEGVKLALKTLGDYIRKMELVKEAHQRQLAPLQTKVAEIRRFDVEHRDKQKSVAWLAARVARERALLPGEQVRRPTSPPTSGISPRAWTEDYQVVFLLRRPKRSSSFAKRSRPSAIRYRRLCAPCGAASSPCPPFHSLRSRSTRRGTQLLSLSLVFALITWNRPGAIAHLPVILVAQGRLSPRSAFGARLQCAEQPLASRRRHEVQRTCGGGQGSTLDPAQWHGREGGRGSPGQAEQEEGGHAEGYVRVNADG